MPPAATARRDPGTVYGRIITGNDVEQAVLATLRDRMPEYIAEVERQRGRDPGALAEPKGYIVASQFSKWPEDQLPVVIVISPGLAGPARRAGDGQVRARWSIAAGIINSAAKIDRTRENALDYVGAIRTLLAQHQALDGLAAGVEWQDENYVPPFPYSDTRTLFGAQAIFAVTVDDVVSYGLGPDGPWGPPPDPTDPLEPPDWPRVKTADVELRSAPIDRPIELVLTDPEE